MSYSWRMGPSTSVIIPVRNGALYITEAMASALAQLGQKDELIIVDDHSTDDTLTVVASIADPRLRMLSTPKRGVSAARNVGLAAARGEFVAFLDHDDLWPAGRHQVLCNALVKNPAFDVVSGRIRIQFEPGIVQSPVYLAMDGKFVPDTSVGSSLFRRSIIDRVGGFAEDMHYGEDLDFTVRLREAEIRFERCEHDALIYRRHASNATNDRRARHAGFFDLMRRKVARTRRHAVPGT